MGKLILKEEIVTAIKNDAKLQGEVAFEMGSAIGSMHRILKENRHKMLTHPNTLRLLSKKLSMPISELTEVVNASECAAA